MKRKMRSKARLFLGLLICASMAAMPVYASQNTSLTQNETFLTETTATKATTSSKIRQAKAAYAKYLDSHRSSEKYFQLLSVKGSSIPVLVTSASTYKVESKNASAQYSIYLYKKGKVTQLGQFDNTSTSCYLTVDKKYIGAGYRMGMRVLHIENGCLSGDVTYYDKKGEQYYYKYFTKYTYASHNAWVKSGNMTKITDKKAMKINNAFYEDGSTHAVNFLKNTAANVDKKC